MTDTELVDFVEKHGVQVWPQRATARPQEQQTVSFTAQLTAPFFIQCTSSTWRHAVSALVEAYDKSNFELRSSSS